MDEDGPGCDGVPRLHLLRQQLDADLILWDVRRVRPRCQLKLLDGTSLVIGLQYQTHHLVINHDHINPKVYAMII